VQAYPAIQALQTRCTWGQGCLPNDYSRHCFPRTAALGSRKTGLQAVDIKHIRYFVEVAESGGFRSASEHLLVTQPPLSRRISALEAELGCRLFDRHARGVSLTIDGVRILARAREILDKVDGLKGVQLNTHAHLSGTVSIGVSEGVGSLVVRRFGSLAQHLHEMHPNVKLRMKNGNSFVLMDGLLSGTIDVAVMVDPQPRGGIRTEKLSTQTFYLTGPPKDRLLARDRISVAELRDLPLILFDRPSSYRMLIDRAAQRAGIVLNVVYEVESSEAVHDVSVRGLAYGVLSASRALRAKKANQLSATLIEDLTLDRMLVVRDGVRHPELVETVAELIKVELSTSAAALAAH
jgi:LysR family transcriptional regulator, nitrogen assimilation regulatory protein